MGSIRVLQVFAGLDRGGSESMLMNVYRHIDRDQLQFDFAVNDSCREYAYESEVLSLGGRVFRMPRPTVTNVVSYRRCWEQLLDAHPEWPVVHGHYTTAAFVYLQTARSRGRITIAHSHHAGHDWTIKSGARALLEYPLRYIAQYRFACSSSAARWLFGRCHTHVKIVKNAIEARRFEFNPVTRTRMRRELRVSDKFVIGHVGRFHPMKNHELLITVFKEIRRSISNAVLLLVGDGPLRQPMEAKVHCLGLADSVVFAGVRADVPELLQAMDVFLFPSLSEGLGMAVVEAQAAGLPCIVSEKIPSEAHVTDMVRIVGLGEPPSAWAAQVKEFYGGHDRLSTYEQIKASGYDVEQTAMRMQEFYLREVRARYAQS